MPRLSLKSTALLAVLAAVACIALLPGATSLAAKARRPVPAKTPADLTVPSIEHDTAAFLAQTRAIGDAKECFPVHLRDVGRTGILYLHCSDAAVAQDGEGVELSSDFSVPTTIARRYNFWRRVYSLWGKDQYVMHLSEYPEVVIEAYDVSRLGSDVTPVRRENQAKRVAKAQRDLYRKLFLTMHRFRDHEELFTPAMQRLARAMAHIKARDKYLVAYQSLRLQRGQRDFIVSGLAVAPKYFPAIEAEFRSQGIPVEVARLAFVESSFNLKACSKVGASGVYQLMPDTGRQYLKMFGGVDERNDPIKASRAAAKLLRLNYAMTGSWPLAITAYNHGVGGIRRAIRVVGSDNLADLINRYRGNAFGFASKNFYASFLGVLASLQDAARLFPEAPRVAPLAFVPVRLAKATSIRDLKKKYAMTQVQVAELNPDLSYGMIRAQGLLPRGYVLKVPSHEARAPAVSFVNASLPPSS